MKGLITGVNGFVGQHLVKELKRRNQTVIGCDMSETCSENDVDEYFKCNISDCKEINNIIRENRPDFCIHLAAITYIPVSWNDPLQTIKTNVLGTVNLLESFRHNAVNSRILIISSVEIYGTNPLRDSIQNEESKHLPDSPYALSKSFIDTIALLYARRYDMQIMSVRPSNHIGPGQASSFVVPSFANQCVKIKCGLQKPIIKVGNLDAQRDFTDVRDIVRAYADLIDEGSAGEAYNIASGRMIRIHNILDKLCQIADVDPEIVVDSEKFREELPRPIVDISKIKQDIGWAPRIKISSSLKDIFQYFLNNVHQ